MDRKLQLVIDRHNDLENTIKIGISQGLPESLILFLIYISEVFEQVEKKLPKIMSLLFVHDLGFIASRTSVEEIARTLEKVDNLIVPWERKNVVTYNTAKTELVLFS